jgi:hypothetical protein
MYQRSSTAGTLTALAIAMASERLSAAETAPNTEHVEVVGQAASIDQALKEQPVKPLTGAVAVTSTPQ